MSPFPALRRLLLGEERERARAEERRLLAGELGRRRAFYDALADAYSSDDDGALELGTCVVTGRAVRLPASRLAGHISVTGPSGCGKSYAITLMLMLLAEGGLRRFLVADPKQELLELSMKMLVTLGKRLPEREARDLWSRVVLIDPFGGLGSSALPLLQVLQVAPDDDPELVGAEVASLITSGSDLGGLGVRQESLLAAALAALIQGALPLTALAAVLLEPELLDYLADDGVAPGTMRAAAARIRLESKDRLLGVGSRLEALFRLRSMRYALSAPSCIDFVELLRSNVVLLNCAPPSGADDIARFWRSLLWCKIRRAVRSRENGAPPTVLVVDEFAQFVANEDMAAGCDELWRLARSKRAFFWVAQQNIASLAKVSSSLPATMRTNSMMLASFRCPEGTDWIPLPVSGCRPRPPGSLWEPARPGYLDASAERNLLTEELRRLPDRHCYLYDARRGNAGLLMKTADLTVDATDAEVAALCRQATSNAHVRPIAELERAAHELEQRLAALRARHGGAVRGGGAPLRRGTRPLEMG